MSEDKRKEEIRRKLSGKSKKVESTEEKIEVVEDEALIEELTTEEILKEEGWVQYYTRGMAAVLKCEKCGNEITAKSERRKTMPVGEKAYLYCRKCNMSYHHECIGYSVFVRKP